MRIADDPDLSERCTELTQAGAEAFLASIALSSSALVPNEPEDIVTWAATNLVLPSSVSARSGPLELNPIQAAIARLWQTTGITQVTLLKSTRFGSSLLNASGLEYFAGHEGVDVIFYERSAGDAQDFHDKKLFPILENSPSMSKLLRPDTKSGVQDAWTDRILTNGASIQLRSASNNGSFRAIKGAFICVDEAGAKEYRDRSKNAEGSKLSLIRRRAQEYSAPVIYLGGTPTRIGECMISAEYARSDKRHFVMPCPHCSEEIAWEPDVRRAEDRSMRYGPGLRYLANEAGVVVEAWYECPCGAQIEETDKIGMMEAGRLEATAVGEPGHAGVFTWAAHSTDLQMTWRHIGAEHMKTLVDPEEGQAFQNTILSLPWDPAPAAVIDPSSLEARAETWHDEHGEIVDAPDETIAIYAGVDNQQGGDDDLSRQARSELIVHGVGANRRRFIIARIIVAETEIYGEKVPLFPFTDAWSEVVWGILEREWKTADGRVLKIRNTAVDNGWNAEGANRFCLHPRSRRLGVIPIRGSSTERNGSRAPVLPADLRLKRSKRSGRDYLYIGTQTIKDTLGRILQIPAPGPESVTFSSTLDRSFYESLLAERLVELRPGVSVWRPISKSNTGEMWDCFVYSYAAERYDMRRNKHLRDQIDPIAPEAVEAALVAAAEEIAQAKPEAPPVDPEEPSTPASTVHPVPTVVQPAVRLTPAQRYRLERLAAATGTAPASATAVEDEKAAAKARRIEAIKRRHSTTGIRW